MPAIVSAQVRPQPGSGDPHIQSVEYRPDQVILIKAASGYLVTIELAPDETVQSAAVGDSTAWQVSTNKAGNRLFVKPVQAGVPTNLTVFTDVRSYAFELSSTDGGVVPYTVRFRYASSLPNTTPPATMPSPPRRYKVGGDRSLRPAAIYDDGVHTYIAWPANAPLPATYTLDEAGREILANGNMRGPFYILDTVAERLVFRIDREVARADRLPIEIGERQ